MRGPVRSVLVVCALAAACTDERGQGFSHGPMVVAELAREGHPVARLEGPWGALAVDAEGALTLHDGRGRRTLGQGAIPELARSPDGRSIAWPRRTATGSEVVRCELPRCEPLAVSGALLVADRPSFAPDGTLYFWGSEASEPLAGLYREGRGGQGARPARLTPSGLTGVDDPRFVPPPTEHGSARFTSPTRLEYVGPSGPRVLELGGTP